VSLKKLGIAFVMVLLTVLAMPNVASAASIITFSVSTGEQPSNVGTITLTQMGTSVNVKVDLIDSTYGFINTGGPHTPFAFTLNGTEAGVTATFSNPTGGSYCPANSTCPPDQFALFSLNTGGGANGDFGTFGVAIDSSANNGTSNAYFGDLEFLLSRPSGLSVNDFISNGSAYFSADLTDGRNTGAQGWNQPGGEIDQHNFDTPEPASMLLLGTGLLVAARARRRKTT